MPVISPFAYTWKFSEPKNGKFLWHPDNIFPKTYIHSGHFIVEKGIGTRAQFRSVNPSIIREVFLHERWRKVEGLLQYITFVYRIFVKKDFQNIKGSPQQMDWALQSASTPAILGLCIHVLLGYHIFRRQFETIFTVAESWYFLKKASIHSSVQEISFCTARNLHKSKKKLGTLIYDFFCNFINSWIYV